MTYYLFPHCQSIPLSFHTYEFAGWLLIEIPNDIHVAKNNNKESREISLCILLDLSVAFDVDSDIFVKTIFPFALWLDSSSAFLAFSVSLSGLIFKINIYFY